MKSPGHQMILASAGSGKTFALTDRYVALLAGGAKPDRIAALTFTRKAAGEFFDEILRKLAGAAADSGVAARLAGGVESRELGTLDFIRMLRSVVDSMHRLNLGTLDSFFARVVRAFPLELGLGGDFEILSEQAARIERRRALRELFAATGGLSDEASRRSSSRPSSARRSAWRRRISGEARQVHRRKPGVFLAAPDPGVWGRAGSIWPGGGPWPAAAAGRGEAALELEKLLPGNPLRRNRRLDGRPSSPSCRCGSREPRFPTRSTTFSATCSMRGRRSWNSPLRGRRWPCPETPGRRSESCIGRGRVGIGPAA